MKKQIVMNADKIILKRIAKHRKLLLITYLPSMEKFLIIDVESKLVFEYKEDFLLSLLNKSKSSIDCNSLSNIKLFPNSIFYL